MKRRKPVWSSTGLLALLGAMIFIQGCGFGWLYMRIGDSYRIEGRKILLYDRTPKRFLNAQQQYRYAIEKYEESILYDEWGNMEVYHKAGFTCLLCNPPDYRRAEAYFLKGIKFKRKQADEAGKSDELKKSEVTEIQYLDIKDEDYAMMHAGVGMVKFLTGVRDRDDAKLRRAIDYFWIADEVSRHLPRKSKGAVNKILDWLDLREIVTPPPYAVMASRVRNFQAESSLKKGQKKLATIYFSQAKELLEKAEKYYPDDNSLFREWAQFYYLQDKPKKALEYLGKVRTQSYSDRVVFKVLKGSLLVAIGKDYDKAIETFNGILELDDKHKKALIGRATAYAHKGNVESAQSDLDKFLEQDDKDPELYLQAGKIYTILKLYDSAEQMFLKGYYIDPKNIELIYHLGTTYKALRKRTEMRDIFDKLRKLAPQSTYTKEIQRYTDR